MDSKALGRLVVPAMKQLHQRIPRVVAAVLCTPDGFNICSFGLEEKQVGKLAALSGSLSSISNATMQELRLGLGEQSMDLLVLEAGAIRILSLKVCKPDGHLVLMVAAKDEKLGPMIVGARYVVGEIEKALRESHAAGLLSAPPTHELPAASENSPMTPPLVDAALDSRSPA